MTITEQTASTFLVQRRQMRWFIGLVWHHRLHITLPAGGHQEPGETIGETAVREVREEAGVRCRLLPLPLPTRFPHRTIGTPWWIAEVPAGPDNHTDTLHVHCDHVFVAEPDGDYSGDAESEVQWFNADELAHADGISEDSRIQGLEILAILQQHADIAPTGLPVAGVPPQTGQE
ncbi:NUDIX domain-containing protein [Amycolatopsis roodepoortensis]|uniref:NUDIX domain-containing protein n=1 Tax=Amycolatopsis roodepoortensis TaxID=700274 RepID=UPI00214AD68F|nr:NUDIX domain-containing protein [Amycolatopsis roodepoortensis]UUV32303.1 NUDIX domain-containing protein [Amycolatopsis roodepoortensis]